MSRMRSGWGLWIGLLVVLVAVGILTTRDETNVRPLDPDSVAGEGARGLVELLRAVGGEVDVRTDPEPDHEVALVLRDLGDDASRAKLMSWARDGGRLVVADPASPLLPPIEAAIGLGANVERGDCSVAALQDVGAIAALSVTFEPGTDDVACFSGGVIVREVGDGYLVGLGGPGPLLNAFLDDSSADNAGLAIALLAPQRGTRVAFLETRPVFATEPESLRDLVPDPVWVLVAQIPVGFLLFAWSRARRLGTPVFEPGEVHIEASELTAARGRLLEAMRTPEAAADDLRADARRLLTRRFGLPRETDDVLLAQRADLHTTLGFDEVLDLLARRPVAGNVDLQAVAEGLARMRAELAGRTQTSPTDIPETSA